MEFHPSYARAVDCASRAANNPPPTSPLAGLDVPRSLAADAAGSGSRATLAPDRPPRLIDLERRVKFARPDPLFA